ncbi:MAG TPA: PQQ-binding-like beta-propeller repeat protein [Thermoanaerobaculia bacterium]|nr:PQQ-binding-like beta-propeller repeat protein [Thermoanaerobaculia bacterium]
MRLIYGIAALLISAPLFGVAPQFWRTATPDEMLGGEVDGFVVTARGQLQPGPLVTKLASVDDPFVLSQTTDGRGVRFLGTGNGGKVYRLEGSKLSLLYTAPEPEVYSLAFANGQLFVGTSPNGKIYRVDPASGVASVFFDPQEAYIWDMASLQDGSFAVATGVEGKLYRVTRAGEGTVWYNAPETHLRSLVSAGPDRLLVGGSGDGRIYEITSSGGRAIYDSQYSEISSLYYDSSTGIAWAAGVSNVLPTTPPARTDAAARGGSTSGSSGERSTQEGGGTATVSISFEDPAATAASTPGGTASGIGAELYRIERDGFVEPVRKFDREIVYALTGKGDGAIYMATGPLGRVYEFRNGQFALVAGTPEKQVVSFNNDRDSIIATTTNSGAVYRIDTGRTAPGEFRSTVRDTGRFSSFGQYRLDGTGMIPREVSVSFRSGNTATPDQTWSDWSAPVVAATGAVNAPSARYLQWKVRSEAPNPRMSLDSMTIAFVNRNVAPVIESLAVADPGVVFISGNYPGPPQVVEATNPDEYGIFTSLTEPTDRATPGKRYFRRGYRTVTWKASDANNDPLRYTVQFRRSGTSAWLRLRENIDDTQLNFDTSQLPDGRYELKLIVSDIRGNPGGALTDTREGVELLVDNAAPVITTERTADGLRIRVIDALSPIGSVEYSVDADKWLPLVPDDGIADSLEETFRIDAASIRNRFVVIRAVDSFFNVATHSVPTGN